MKHIRIAHLCIGCLFIITMICFKEYYRPWIYNHALFDLYLADTYTNLFGVPVVFFIYSFAFPKNIYKPIELVISIVIALVLYELCTGWLGGICDYKDMVATCVGGLLSLGINRLILKNNRQPKDNID